MFRGLNPKGELTEPLCCLLDFGVDQKIQKGFGLLVSAASG